MESAADNTIAVTNNNGQMITVQARTVNLVFGDKPAEAATRFIRDALAREGMDSMAVRAEDNQGGGFVVSVWTRAGEQLRLPGKYRVVAEVPCLAAWTVQ